MYLRRVYNSCEFNDGKTRRNKFNFELCGESDFYDFSCVQFWIVNSATVYRPHWLRLVNSSKCVIFNANHCLFFCMPCGNVVVPPTTNRWNQTNNWTKYYFLNTHFCVGLVARRRQYNQDKWWMWRWKRWRIITFIRFQC